MMSGLAGLRDVSSENAVEEPGVTESIEENKSMAEQGRTGGVSDRVRGGKRGEPGLYPENDLSGAARQRHSLNSLSKACTPGSCICHTHIETREKRGMHVLVAMGRETFLHHNTFERPRTSSELLSLSSRNKNRAGWSARSIGTPSVRNASTEEGQRNAPIR
jgi:hypothetical protein